MRRFLLFVTRVQVLMAVLVLAILLTPPRVVRYGDTLQGILPIMALACEAKVGTAGEYFLRYVPLQLIACLHVS